MKTLQTLISIFLTLFYFSDGNAQIVNQAGAEQIASDAAILKDRINNADLIVEAKMLEKKACWAKNHSTIYTSNILIVYKLFKGQLLNDTIEIVTAGGFFDDSINGTKGVKVSHAPQIGREQEGIFFLRYNNWHIQDIEKNNSYVLYDNYQIPYFYNGIYPPALCGAVWFKSVDEVYPFICNTLGVKYTILSQRPGRKIPTIKQAGK